MRIKAIKLINYRNYSHLEFNPCEGLNALVGENAQGKTNLLEAVFLCAFGRSHRMSRDIELIKNDQNMSYIGLSVTGYTGSRQIEVKLSRGEGKKILLDSCPIGRSGELLGVLNAVMFSPEDLSLVKDGPAMRRRFMDMELSQLNPSYYYRLQQYNHALKQRNALLKDNFAPSSPGLLAMWDEQLANLGESVINARKAFIEELSGIAGELHRMISDGRETLGIAYEPDIRASCGISLHDAIIEALSSSALEDIRRGFTTAGPHRDDISISVNESDARIFGSQGQQRTAALSLKLSEIEIMKRHKSEPPVLLLDDVLSELDEIRQRMLVKSIEGVQVLLTCTALAGLKNAGLKDAKVYECKCGTLRET
ncbi:MAG: DNA replication and repair protein RecF [Firmicutes bacterium ADurb.Bin182]|nr:MAG: DNA replication and repair protein RecF [Firmicutes bacterium ADurb.Bin182]